MKKDFLLNFIAVALPIGVLQLGILPVVNSVVGNSSYGFIVSLVAVLNAVPVAMGNSLCNTRQLLEGTYLKQQIKGDFNLLLVMISAAGIIISFCCASIFGFGWFDAMLLGACGGLMAVYNYQIVVFRLDLDYRGMLAANTLVAAAMLVGMALFLTTGCWQLVFVLGYAAGSVYVACKTNVMRGGVGRSPLWNDACKVEGALLFSLLLSGLVNYGDRLILLPLQGSVAVSIFYIASLVGKLLVMVISPMSTVVLSYVIRTDAVDKESTFKLLGISSVIGLAFWMLTIALAPVVLGVLYPNEVDQAVLYVPLVTAVSVLQAQCSLLNPTIMRFYSAKWQVLCNALALGVLLIGGFLLSDAFGLMGFCAACLLSTFSKLLMICVLVFIVNSNSSYEALEPKE